MTNDEARMTKEAQSPNDTNTVFGFQVSCFFRHSFFVIRHSSEQRLGCLRNGLNGDSSPPCSKFKLVFHREAECILGPVVASHIHTPSPGGQLTAVNKGRDGVAAIPELLTCGGIQGIQDCI
jgi:hypothetical protein